MAKLIIFFCFYFLFLAKDIYSQNTEINIPLRRNEEVLLGFYNYEKYFILSKINNILILKKIYPDRRINEFVTSATGEIIHANFFEDNDLNKIIYVFKNNDQYYLKIFDENFNLYYDNRIFDSNLKLINVFLWKEQSKLLFFTKENGYLKIFSFELNNNILNSTNTNITLEKDILNIYSYQHYLFLIEENDRGSNIFVFNRFLNLINISFWENLKWQDYDSVGNILYLCGYDKNRYIKIFSYDFINRRILEHNAGEVKFENLLECDYISGDINNLFYLYNQDRKMILKSLYSDINLILENAYIPRGKIEKSYHKIDDLFDGFISYIISNPYRINILRINIHNNNFSLRNYSNSYFINVDNNVVFIKNNFLNIITILDFN